MNTLTFANLSFRLPLSPFVVFALLALIFAIWAIFTVIVRYHWKNYGIDDLVFLKMNIYYFVGSGVLLGCASLFAFLYNFSSLST